jgi:hypothetical protein
MSPPLGGEEQAKNSYTRKATQKLSLSALERSKENLRKRGLRS